ncbi:MAG: tRNA (N(6)-L-threonylcarbamoyladenosine(37)-C(2))-methylthiotransferase MtaB [Mangrovibacterium sp.]
MKTFNITTSNSALRTPHTKTIAFKTLGCRLNQYETDALVTEFDNAGYEVVDFKEKADVVVVNTCTVTNQSDQKSRNIISQAARNNQGSVVVVTGCMVNNYKEKLESEDKITYVVENNRKGSILNLVESHFSGEMTHPDKLNANVFQFNTVDKSLHTRSSIKIQDGCNNFCSYCIIPTVRGRATSRPLPNIIKNVENTLANGFKELVITGVNIGRYDWEGKRVEDVILAILEIEGDFRVRISSLEPDGFTNDFVELFKHPKLTPHLHLCLQSGSNEVLKRMRRMHSREDFNNTVAHFRSVIPNFNFTTDLIVGFPGETDSEFEESINAVKELNFGHVHTFKYSVRRGTKAERMENHINGTVKSERSEQLRTIAEEERTKYLKSFIGKTQTMLTEGFDSQKRAKGYGEHYLPLRIVGEGLQRNAFYQVRITGIEGYGEKAVLIATT